MRNTNHDTASDSARDREFADSIRAKGFEAAAIFTSHDQSPLPAAFLCYMAGIPRRLAYCRENPSHLLTDWVREVEPEKIVRHEVARQLELVAWSGCHTSDERLRLRIPDEARRKVAELLKKRGIDTTKPYMVVHPGAHTSRLYPTDSFSEVIRDLHARLGYQVILTGTEPERTLLTAIQETSRVPCHSVGGELSLAEFAALFTQAALLISNSTFAVQVAAAMRVPTVKLYALANPQHGPWLVPHRVLCPEKKNGFLSQVEPSEVVGASLDLLEELGIRKKIKNRVTAWAPAILRRGAVLPSGKHGPARLGPPATSTVS